MKFLNVACPGCGKSYSVDKPELIGKAARCKQCGTRFTITDQRGKTAPVSDQAHGSAVLPAEADSHPVRPIGLKAPQPAPAPSAEPAGVGKAPVKADDEPYPDDSMTLSLSEYEARKQRELLREMLQKKAGKAPK